MTPARLFAAALVAAGFIGGCGQAPPQSNPAWVINTRILFVGKDLSTPREPPPRAAFKLWLPFIAGDLYGAPTTGDYLNATIAPDYTTTIDLNKAHDALLASLEPTAFGLSGLSIVPKDARIARLAPQLIEADGIEQLGTAEFLDTNTKERLLLLYFDRPAAISGHLEGRDGSTIDYDIRCDHAGYQWVAMRTEGAGTRLAASAWLQRAVIAVTPP